MSEDQIQRITKALADPRRYEILKRLRDCDQPLPCESVRGCMSITPATLSHHMKELETAGLIQVIREHKYVSYVLRRDILEAFLNHVKSDLL